MIDNNTQFIVSLKNLKYVISQIITSNAKWEGEKCPECHQFLEKKEKLPFLYGYNLVCPQCRKGFDRAEDYLITRFKKINIKKENIENLQPQEIRKILKQNAKENKKIEEFIES